MNIVHLIERNKGDDIILLNGNVTQLLYIFYSYMLEINSIQNTSLNYGLYSGTYLQEIYLKDECVKWY